MWGERRAARVRVASWNIHGGVGGDGRYDPLRIAAVLAEIDADVVALQEVASREEDGDLLAQLAAATGRTIVAAPTHRRTFGDFGNALLTSLPVVASLRIDLAIAGREPRNALDVVVDAAAGPLRILATHLGLVPGERREQVRRLLRALESDAPMTTVLMGDLNEWFLWGRPLRWLHRHFRRTPAPPTFPAKWPLLALDRLWVEPATSLARIRVHRSGLARVASDHLPVVAEVLVG